MTKVSPIALTTVIWVIAFSGVAFAQDAAQVPSAASPQVRPIKAIQEKRADLREAAKDVRADFKVGAKDLRVETKEKMKAATSSTERREIEKNAIEKRKELIDTRKAGVKEIRDQKKELARQHVGIIEQRYAVAIKQFDNLASRIQSRIDKLKAGGADTSKAGSALAAAAAAIAQVKADAQALADLRAQVKSGDDAKALRAQIEAAVKKVNASIKSAHTALEKAGKELVLATRQKSQTETTSETTAD